MTESHDFGTVPAAPTVSPTLEKAAPRDLSPLEQMKAQANVSLERFVHYPVTGREGMVLKFSTLIDPDDMKRYQRNGQGKKKDPADADHMLVCAQILQEASRAIYLNSKVVASEDGSDWTLSHKEFITAYGDMGTVEAIKQLLGGPQVLSMANQLVDEAGYGARFNDVDPTKP